MLVYFYLGWCWLMKQQQEVVTQPSAAPIECNRCGGTMILAEITDGEGYIVYRRPLPQHSIAYLDSG